VQLFQDPGVHGPHRAGRARRASRAVRVHRFGQGVGELGGGQPGEHARGAQLGRQQPFGGRHPRRPGGVGEFLADPLAGQVHGQHRLAGQQRGAVRSEPGRPRRAGSAEHVRPRACRAAAWRRAPLVDLLQPGQLGSLPGFLTLLPRRDGPLVVVTDPAHRRGLPGFFRHRRR
jgi:hypothetical protein